MLDTRMVNVSTEPLDVLPTYDLIPKLHISEDCVLFIPFVSSLNWFSLCRLCQSFSEFLNFVQIGVLCLDCVIRVIRVLSIRSESDFMFFY